MSDTPLLSLPLLASAQAQKHVTMNEALLRLDALSAPTAKSADLSTPPAGMPGDTYIIADFASGDWLDHDGDIAFWVNDGWSFASPKPGWRVWVEDRSEHAVWSGTSWLYGMLGGFGLGAYMRGGVVSGEETFSPGASFATTIEIPDRAVVLGVSACVTAAINGSGLTGWRVGVAGATDRYGNSIGLAAGTVLNGISGTPTGYYGATPLQVTAEGGTFSTGAARFAIHYLALTPPDLA